MSDVKITGFARNEEALTAEKARLDREAENYGSGASMLFLQKGHTMLRILPPWNAEGKFFKQIYKHGIFDKVRFTGICPKQMFGTECPLCDKGEELFNSGNESLLWRLP